MIEARVPVNNIEPACCVGCGGSKHTPIATVLSIGRSSNYDHMPLCEECGRDLANAVGYMCIRDGGWSKLEPRKKKPKATDASRRRVR